MADRSDHVTATRLVHKGPCIVKNLHLAHYGASAGAAVIYDGENAHGEVKAKISAGVSLDGDWTPGTGTDFDFGIYITLEIGGVCTVTYKPESRKHFE